jgi:uncharacterized protein YecE (DUF72 family)
VSGHGAGRLFAGTSGFSYPTWRGGFYPADARPGEFLRLYAERLPSVELIATYRRLPTKEQVRRWADQTPPGFRFAPKLNGQISHGGKLGLMETFNELMRELGDRLGPIRIQIVRRRDDDFLERLLSALDPELSYALDLEHETWRSPEVDAMVAAAGVARVGELEGGVDFRYVRFREPPYEETALAEWARRLGPLLDDGVDVYCYFRHEDDPRGAQYALRLLELAGS